MMDGPILYKCFIASVISQRWRRHTVRICTCVWTHHTAWRLLGRHTHTHTQFNLYSFANTFTGLQPFVKTHLKPYFKCIPCTNSGTQGCWEIEGWYVHYNRGGLISRCRQDSVISHCTVLSQLFFNRELHWFLHMAFSPLVTGNPA